MKRASMPRADVTVVDRWGDTYTLTYWNEWAVSDVAARDALRRECAKFAALHPGMEYDLSPKVLSVVLS